jgi:hypothetical protein
VASSFVTVSLPAVASSEKNMRMSSSSSRVRSPSSSSSTSTRRVIKSCLGWRRRSAISSVTYFISSSCASIASRVGIGLPGSRCSIRLERRCTVSRSASGMPSIVLITSIGRRAVKSFTASKRGRPTSGSRYSHAMRRIIGSSSPIFAGVNAFETSLRYRVCRGGSIQIISPVPGFGVSMNSRLVPLFELYVTGSTSAS